MTDKEQEEYFSIGKELKSAFKKCFNPDLYNYATLANISPHLHTHVIPRYAFPRNFAGRVFTDLNWGQNYVPYDKNFKLEESVLMEIKEEIKKALKSTF
jgi:diadenosine tetraphosphate (Ap4A) HIT family hydrolase